MTLEYISHSCFLVKSKGIKLIFDPWIKGTAYQGQWQLYPKPMNLSQVKEANLVLISHGHEDHLHHESLKEISKNATVFFPFQWRAGIVSYLKGMGFGDVKECVSFRTYEYQHIKVTFLGFSLESVIVVEAEDQVIVNINDSLNSNHKTAVKFLIDSIKKRWDKIDFLLSGWSGAGYFPNMVHFKGKDDKEIAKIREQYFADNFCKFTKALNPTVAIPFAPGFALLEDSNRWINEVKFPRTEAENYYKTYFDKGSKVQFPIMFPGDYFEGDQFIQKSPLHAYGGDEALCRDIPIAFDKEIKEANRIVNITEEEISVLVKDLKFWLKKNAGMYDREVIDDVNFSIFCKDITVDPWLCVTSNNGELTLVRDSKAQDSSKMNITTRGTLLALNLTKDWGGDLLTIGYGLDVEVFDGSCLENNLDIVCVRLITRFPMFKDDMLSHTGRIMKYYFNNPALTHLWLKQKISLRSQVNKRQFNERDRWITFNKCELCKVCKIPEYNFENSEEVGS
jgi:hypothetical protein